jgi:hypothetical protein
MYLVKNKIENALAAVTALPLALAFATASAAQPGNPEMKLTLPDGKTVVAIDCDLLGPAPDYTLTNGFVFQFDPHAAPRLKLMQTEHLRQIDAEVIRRMQEHLEKEHDLRPAQIDQVRSRCMKILEERPKPEP